MCMQMVQNKFDNGKIIFNQREENQNQEQNEQNESKIDYGDSYYFIKFKIFNEIIIFLDS